MASSSRFLLPGHTLPVNWVPYVANAPRPKLTQEVPGKEGGRRLFPSVLDPDDFGDGSSLCAVTLLEENEDVHMV